MPQRFLKPGIVTSRKWDSCSWIAQSFYIRLLTLVDDFGRYEADPMLLKSHAFPLREDVSSAQVSAMCKELSDSKLASFYESDGKLYMQLTNWTERPRAATSKFPFNDNTCKQMFADDSKCSAPSSSSSSSSPSSSSINRHMVAVAPCVDAPSNAQAPDELPGMSTRSTYHPDTRTALHILNEACGRYYREVDANLKVISARLREPGVTIDGVRQMIQRQCQLWKGTELGKYLRPETLFRQSKFDGYYAARGEPVVRGGPNHRNDGLVGGVDPNKARRVLERRAAEAAARAAASTPMAGQVA